MIPNKRTWGSVKQVLRGFTATQLLAVIHDLHDTSEENRRFLHARFADTDAERERCRRTISDALDPDPFSSKRVSIRAAKRALRTHMKATGDAMGSVDLMLSFVEAGTSHAVEYGYGDEAFFSSLAGVLDDALNELEELSPEKQQGAVQRLERLHDRARPMGWGYGDFVCEAIESFLAESGANARGLISSLKCNNEGHGS